jgi:cysteine desulfurase family protein (TIGR01976 family)
MPNSFPIQDVRSQFPGLKREINANHAVCLDGPAGSQVPVRVAEAVARYLLNCNANDGGFFVTSQETQALVQQAQRDYAAFFGTTDPSCVVFGPNMTSLTFNLSRAWAKTWGPGDEIILSDLDHDANVSPWVLGATEAGAVIKRIPVNLEDGTLNLEAYAKLLSDRTRLVAVGLASNITGTINPVRKMADMAHAVGARVYVDAVHYGPHGLLDVEALGCDALVCSAYKFFGPHVGILWAQKDLLTELPAYKVRPAKDKSPDRWMTGTPNYEGIVGAAEAVRYLASVASDQEDLRPALVESFAAIRDYEMQLLAPLMEALSGMPGVHICGISDPDDFENRVPTVSFTHDRLSTDQIAEQLAAVGICVWSGHHYALRYSEAAGLEPGGTLRIGLLHYNTEEEVQRTIEALRRILA